MKKKRALSFLLAVCMVIPMLTVSGVAAGTATEAYKPEAIDKGQRPDGRQVRQ